MTSVDDAVLAAGLRRMAATSSKLRTSFEQALAETAGTDWERSVLAAVGLDEGVRSAMLGECLSELDFRMRRWARVPRVAASLASSFGFLLASLCLRVGLSGLVASADAAVVRVNDAVLDAIDVSAVGLVGAAFAAAVHYRARVVAASRFAGASRLVDALDCWVEGGATPLAAQGERASVTESQGSRALP